MLTETETELLNGINVAALRQAIDDIKADPAAGRTEWKVASRWQGGTRTDHQVDGFAIGGTKVQRQFQLKIDEPAELCGSNQFANPQEYLLAATNACMMVGYATVAAVMGVKLAKLEIETTGDIDLRGFLDIDRSVAPGYQRLYCRIRIAGDGTREQFAKMQEVVERTSPNYYNIANPIDITSELLIE